MIVMGKEFLTERFQAEAYLPEIMGWTDIDSDDGVTLRGINPMNGKARLIPSHVWDEDVTCMIRDLILEIMKYPDGGEIGYRLDGKRWEMRACFFRLGTDEKDKFECVSEFSRTSTALAAFRLFKSLGALPELPNWYACKKVRERYKLRPYELKIGGQK